MHKRIYFLCVLLAITLSWVRIGLTKQHDKLVIAVQPTATAEQLSTQAKELENFLENRLGQDVEIFFPTSYAGVVEALRFGHAQAAFMGAWPALLAQKHAGASVILAEVREVIIDQGKKEAPYYFSYWVVPAGSPYQTLTELKGKKVAFPSQLSTSGYVAPLAKLVTLGLVSKKEDGADAKEFFSEVLFAGGYAQGWEALKAGQVDVTVIAGDVPEKLYRDVLDNTRILEKQGHIPSHAVVVAQDMDTTLKDKLVNVFMELNAPEHRALMRKFISGIFVRFEPAGTEHLQSLEGMLEATGLEFQDKK
jgi:phosphonate transport system substrate-binding protein